MRSVNPQCIAPNVHSQSNVEFLNYAYFLSSGLPKSGGSSGFLHRGLRVTLVNVTHNLQL